MLFSVTVVCLKHHMSEIRMIFAESSIFMEPFLARGRKLKP